jgi:hypothetical protein
MSARISAKLYDILWCAYFFRVFVGECYDYIFKWVNDGCFQILAYLSIKTFSMSHSTLGPHTVLTTIDEIVLFYDQVTIEGPSIHKNKHTKLQAK